MKINGKNIITAQGAQGVTGIQGPVNVSGSQGTQGTQGPIGISGSAGAQGITAIRGLQNVFNFSSGDVITTAITAAALTTTIITANRINLIPFTPAKDLKYSSFQIYVTSGITSLTRILIYSNGANVPDTKLYESTDLDCSTIGYKVVSTSGTFNAGVTYWIGWYSNGSPTLSTINLTQTLSIYSSPASYVMYTGYYRSVSYGLAPTTFTSPTTGTISPILIGITAA